MLDIFGSMNGVVHQVYCVALLTLPDLSPAAVLGMTPFYLTVIDE
jgi:hypothetical protein